MILKVLLETTIYSWILFAAIMLLKKIIRKLSSPALQYLLWFLLIARLCIPMTFDSGIHLFVIPRSYIPMEQSIDIAEFSPIADHNDDIISIKTAPVIKKSQGDQASNAYESVSNNEESPILLDNSKGITNMETNWYQVVIGFWLVGIADE